MADLVFPGESPGPALNSDAMPSNHDLYIYKGDYVEIFVVLNDSLGDPLDLTGFTAAAQLKTNYDDSAPVDFECTIDAPLTGEVRIYLPSTSSSTLTPGDYIWDFQVANASGDVRTYLAGDVTVYDEVTTE